MQEGSRADNFVEDYQRGCHQRARLKLSRCGKGGRIELIHEDGPSATACRSNLFSIHKSLNLRGNYLSSQFESREMEGGCRGMKLRNSDETVSQLEKSPGLARG